MSAFGLASVLVTLPLTVSYSSAQTHVMLESGYVPNFGARTLNNNAATKQPNAGRIDWTAKWVPPSRTSATSPLLPFQICPQLTAHCGTAYRSPHTCTWKTAMPPKGSYRISTANKSCTNNCSIEHITAIHSSTSLIGRRARHSRNLRK